MPLNLARWGRSRGALASALVLAFSVFLVACGADPTPTPTVTPRPAATPTPKAAWEIDWEKTLAAAEEEGEVIVTIFRADDRASVEKFSNFFPKIKAVGVVLSGRDATVKIPEERKAGLFQYDVYLSGGTSAITRLIPLGKKTGDPILGNTRALLIRPDVLGDENWIGGFEDHWIDDQDDRNVLFKMYADPAAAGLWVNTELVSSDLLRTPEDLLKPEFKGKWCSDDPRTPGSGASFFTYLLLTKGEGFVRRLLGETDMIIGTDGRAMAQDIIRGDVLACVGPEIEPFHEQRVGLHVVSQELPLGEISPEYRDKVITTCCGEGKKKSQISGFYGASISGPAVFTKPPHPNAAKIFINWLLTQEGQLAWNEPLFRTCSSRVDMIQKCVESDSPPPFVLEDGKAYITFHSQTNVQYRRAAQDIARDIFGR